MEGLCDPNDAERKTPVNNTFLTVHASDSIG